MKWLKSAGFGVGKALSSVALLEILEVLAKNSQELPDAAVAGIKIALQALVLIRAFHNNPDGTPATEPFVKGK